MFIKTIILELLSDSTGATAIEYGLLAGLIAVALFGAISGVAASNQSGWTHILNSVNAATGTTTSA